MKIKGYVAVWENDSVLAGSFSLTKADAKEWVEDEVGIGLVGDDVEIIPATLTIEDQEALIRQAQIKR